MSQPMPLSNAQKMAFLHALELISTIVFVGTISIGFTTLISILLYNMSFVLLNEAWRSPFLAAANIAICVTGALFLAEQMMGPDEKDEEEEDRPVPPAPVEADPSSFDEDPIAI